MLEKEIQMKRMKKRWKRKIRSVYREIRSEVECKLATTIDDYIDIKVNPEYRLAIYILMKKLERKGYRCILELGKIDWFRGRCEDILDIYFD